MYPTFGPSADQLILLTDASATSIAAVLERIKVDMLLLMATEDIFSGLDILYMHTYPHK